MECEAKKIILVICLEMLNIEWVTGGLMVTSSAGPRPPCCSPATLQVDVYSHLEVTLYKRVLPEQSACQVSIKKCDTSVFFLHIH